MRQLMRFPVIALEPVGIQACARYGRVQCDPSFPLHTKTPTWAQPFGRYPTFRVARHRTQHDAEWLLELEVVPGLLDHMWDKWRGRWWSGSGPKGPKTKVVTLFRQLGDTHYPQLSLITSPLSQPNLTNLIEPNLTKLT